MLASCSLREEEDISVCSTLDSNLGTHSEENMILLPAPLAHLFTSCLVRTDIC